MLSPGVVESGAWSAFKLVAPWVLVLGSATSAQDAASFAEDRALVRRAMANEQWSKARQDLLELLEEHGPADHVMAQAAALRDELRVCAFGASYREPRLDTLLAGKVRTYSASSGKFEVRYDAKTPELPPIASSDDSGLVHLKRHSRGHATNTVFRPSDFIRLGDGLLVHPVPFVGPCTVEVEGRLTKTDPRTQPRVLVAIEDDAYFDVTFTWPRYDPTFGISSSRGTIEHIEEGAREMVSADTTLMGKDRMGIGRTYRAKVIVKGDSIRATINGIPGLDTEASADLVGRVGWIDELFASHRRAAAEVFELDHVPDDLPEWLPIVRSSAVRGILDAPGLPSDAPHVHAARAPPGMSSGAGDSTA